MHKHNVNKKQIRVPRCMLALRVTHNLTINKNSNNHFHKTGDVSFLAPPRSFPAKFQASPSNIAPPHKLASVVNMDGLLGYLSRQVFLAFVAVVSLTLVNGNLVHRRFEYKYSFKPPYLAQKDGSIPFWEYGGSKCTTSTRQPGLEQAATYVAVRRAGARRRRV